MNEPQPLCRLDEHDEMSVDRSFDPAACERAAAIFRALGDPNRLRILMALQREEQCVTAIAEAMQDNLPAVSQRLKLLRSERIIKSRREGKHIFYSLADDCIAELITHALTHASEATAKPATAVRAT